MNIPEGAKIREVELGRAYYVGEAEKRRYFYPFSREYFGRPKETFLKRLARITGQSEASIREYARGARYNKDLYLYAKKIRDFDQNFARISPKEQSKNWALLVYDTENGEMSLVRDGQRKDYHPIEAIMTMRQLGEISINKYYKLLRSRGFLKNGRNEWQDFTLTSVAELVSADADA